MWITPTAQEIKEMEDILVFLKSKKMKIAFAESCSGGLLASLVTRFPGVSEIFQGSVVAYSNEMKEKLLGVQKKTLQTFGAVSPETALEMSLGVFQSVQVNCAASITGIAGPTGATEKKPLGMVCFGFTHQISSAQVNHPGPESFVKTEFFNGDRQSIQLKASMYALRTLHQIVSKK